jgi:hypothetical protein
LRSFLKYGLAILAVAAIGLRAELSKWVENIDAGSRLEAEFFRNVILPAGPVPVRRPPVETRAELTKLIAAAPSDAELYTLRALEAEQQLDFAAAEADWKKNLEISSDKQGAGVQLADYYHRRLQSKEEYDALSAAAFANAPDAEKSLPDAQQRRWKIYERVIKLIDEQRLDAGLGLFQYSAWMLQYPSRPQLYQAFFHYAMEHGRYDVASEAADKYARDFPKDQEFPVSAKAAVAAKIGTPAQARAVYEASFRPAWPTKLVDEYFDLLRQNNALRSFLDRAKAAVAANPDDLTSAAKIFFYWQVQKNPAQAERALREFEQRKKSAWTADELLTLGRLFESVHDYDEAARNYYAMYTVARADDAAETALGSLARLMFSAPEQPIHFGSGNLSLYRDVATMDPHPGYLNGVLSLLLNTSDPGNKYALEEQSAAAYFHRASAAELVTLFESRFPNSPQRAELRESVIEAYAVSGSSDGVIRAAAKFLTDFPDAPNRTAAAMRLADAYARTNRTREEFATYDSLLTELARRAGGIPLGALPSPPKEGSKEASNEAVRSPEYARVLDRYVARLVSMKRVPDALALYRREIERNPKDPGLYDTLAAFLEQNRLGAEIAQVYQGAMNQFQDHTWEHKLARFYLRQKRQADVSRLTRDVIRIFAGTELEAYFREIVHPTAPVGPALYLQLNLYAHQRFPHNLSFVRNLLGAYSAAATRDPAAYEALLRQHWYDADDLRMRFFERLSRTGKLDAELSAIRAESNPAAERFLAEGEAWRGHFEAASPVFLKVESAYLADRGVGQRTAALYRSFGAAEAKSADVAISVEEKLAQADPRSSEALTRIGEMEADRGNFDRAAAAWNKIPEIAPAKPESYLDAATAFWDYLRYDDALRLIELARKQTNTPALFAYQAGAIRENQRDYSRAAREYAAGAIAQPGESPSQSRLIALARRPSLRTDIEQLTANLVSARNPQAGALELRVALLRNQNRRDDLDKLLLAVAGRTTSAALLAQIENIARVDGLANAQRTAMERQVQIAADPMDRLQMRLTLVRFDEAQGRAAQSAQEMDALYRENPAILGVVRAEVDFAWRNKNAKRAVDVLEEAAGRAMAPYRESFTLEAARKALESGDYGRARTFAAKLLEADANRAEYVAVMADTYARQHDDQGLRAFYDSKIRELNSQKRIEDVAAIRRNLAPVLTRMKDYSGALDQYMEILNRYPEDEALTREAAAYAAQHGMAQRLRDTYTKAVNDSPKDYRWPMVLARVEAQLEDYPAAIGAYTRASTARPERSDLLVARLNLEERLLRFDDAAATASKLYDLTYRDPKWMEKLAQIRARQGRGADAVAALRRALIDGHADSAKAYADMAETLESWNMLAEARTYAQEAKKRSAEDGSRIYIRVLMRQREVAAALAEISALDDTFAHPAIADLGNVVKQYYGPDDQAKLAAALENDPHKIEIAENAGLQDVEAKWLAAALTAEPAGDDAKEQERKLIDLQRSRFQFNELGSQLEAYDRVLPPAQRSDELTEAATAYRASGNAAAELRVLGLQHVRAALSGPMLDRYCELLMAQPQALAAAIARERRAGAANAMLNYVVEHGSAPVVQQAIAARAAREGQLWSKAYTSLAGLYFSSNAAAVKSSFTGLLGDMNIGSRLGKPVDRTQQLAGDQWFYYGGRYGEYLGVTRQSGAGDYLPAMLEATPGRSDAYFALAEYFRNAGDSSAAAADYGNALELNPGRADVHDRLALMAAKSGRVDEAAAEWRLAIAAFLGLMNQSHVPPAFWADFGDTLRHIGDAHQLAPLRAEIDSVLKIYIRRNGAYQVDSLLEGVLAADPAGGMQWIADLSRAAADPVQFLGFLINQQWISDAQKDVLYARLVESAQARMAQSYGDHRTGTESELLRWQITWADYLMTQKQYARARAIVTAFSEEARTRRANEIVPLEIRTAARTNTLSAQLAAYREPLPLDDLRNAATALMADGDAASGRRVLEFVYTHELDAGRLDSANFLGLAEIRLQENNGPAAMTLLRRMALVSGEAFTNLDPAAALLEKTGHTAEAAEFLSSLVKAEPWNADARERLASAQNSADALAVIAKSADIPYRTRASAALAVLRLKGAPVSGTEAELALLSSSNALTEADVNHAYLVEARVEAARAASAPAVRERILMAAAAVDAKQVPGMELFRAALDNHHDALAVSIGDRLFETTFAEYDRAKQSMPDADRLALWRGLGDAELRLGNLAGALSHYQAAQSNQPQERTQRAIESIRARMDLEARNNARRPVISDALDQDRLVHPKESVR